MKIHKPPALPPRQTLNIARTWWEVAEAAIEGTLHGFTVPVTLRFEGTYQIGKQGFRT